LPADIIVADRYVAESIDSDLRRIDLRVQKTDGTTKILVEARDQAGP
jgi:hypothetical protein